MLEKEKEQLKNMNTQHVEKLNQKEEIIDALK